MYEIISWFCKKHKNEQDGFIGYLLVTYRYPLEKSSTLLWFHIVMKKAIVSLEYQSTTRKHEVKKQIYAHHFPDFSLGAVHSLTSAQQPVS